MNEIDSLLITFDAGVPAWVALGVGSSDGCNTSKPQDIYLHSLEHEKVILSALIQNPSLWSEVNQQVNASDFFHENNCCLFSYMSELSDLGVSFDVISLSEALDRKGALDEVGGLDAVVDLARMPYPIDISKSIEVVTSLSLVRMIFAAALRNLELTHLKH